MPTFRNDGDLAVRDLATLREATAKLAEAAEAVMVDAVPSRNCISEIVDKQAMMALRVALAAVNKLLGKED